MDTKELKRIFWIFIIGSIIILCAPFLLTHLPPLILFDKMDGNIGDTIGGITAPLASLLGSVLVFYALKAQINANKIIQDQINDQKTNDENRRRVQYISEKIQMIRNDINDFSYTIMPMRDVKSQYKGSDAFSMFVSDLFEFIKIKKVKAFDGFPKLSELNYLLNSIYLLLQDIDNENIAKSEKDFFYSLIQYQYSSKVNPAFKDIILMRNQFFEQAGNLSQDHVNTMNNLFSKVQHFNILLNAPIVI
ncbi:MAG TPA: hypothetical protein VK590_03840 [Saprospiraceae bacterium]|nr:hypothetical protein [Saprospiraceae bacterium]